MSWSRAVKGTSGSSLLAALNTEPFGTPLVKGARLTVTLLASGSRTFLKSRCIDSETSSTFQLEKVEISMEDHVLISPRSDDRLGFWWRFTNRFVCEWRINPKEAVTRLRGLIVCISRTLTSR